MAHPIKFRVWDKEEKFFVPDGQVAIDSKGMLYSYDKIKDCFVNETLKLEISWFTGLYDKNGKEIYEGDLLCNDVTNHLENIYVVIFSTDSDIVGSCGCCYPAFEGSAFMAKLIDKKFGFVQDIDNVVVIGNIYENPEKVPDVR